MSSNIVNSVAFLRTSREFPHEDMYKLVTQIDKSYVDTAMAVNSRTIGIYPINRPAQTGNNYYLTSQNTSSMKQSTLRQVYMFTAAGNIVHNIVLDQISGFVQCFGSFTDGTNWYGAIYASNTAIAGQVTFYITPTNLVVVAGAGAPSIVSGTIVLEWATKV